MLFSLHVSQQTPLHIATENGYKYTVESLVKKEADISISDHEGVSTCMWDYTTHSYVLEKELSIKCRYSKLTR